MWSIFSLSTIAEKEPYWTIECRWQLILLPICCRFFYIFSFWGFVCVWMTHMHTLQMFSIFQTCDAQIIIINYYVVISWIFFHLWYFSFVLILFNFLVSLNLDIFCLFILFFICRYSVFNPILWLAMVNDESIWTWLELNLSPCLDHALKIRQPGRWQELWHISWYKSFSMVLFFSIWFDLIWIGFDFEMFSGLVSMDDERRWMRKTNMENWKKNLLF